MVYSWNKTSHVMTTILLKMLIINLHYFTDFFTVTITILFNYMVKIFAF